MAGVINLILLFHLLFFGVDPPAQVDPREEYYRGIYDVCIAQGIKNHYEVAFVKVACTAYVKEKVSMGWFEKKSEGWKWPIKREESGG